MILSKVVMMVLSLRLMKVVIRLLKMEVRFHLKYGTGVIEQFLKEKKLIILLLQILTGHLLLKILMRVTVMKAPTLCLESKLLNLQIPTNY